MAVNNLNTEQSTQSGIQPASQTSGALGTGYTPGTTLSAPAERIRQAALQNVLSQEAGSADAPYAEGLRQLEAQKATARTSKELAGLGAIQSIGDLQNQIYENQRKRLEQSAASGFMGGGQAIRSEKAFQRQEDTSEGTIQRNLLNAIRQGNISIDQLSNQELQSLSATGAMSDEIAKEVMRRQAGGENLFSKTEPSFWDRLGNALKPRFIWQGSDLHGSATLNRDALKNSEYFKSLASDLGLDMNNQQVMDRLATHVNTLARTNEHHASLLDAAIKGATDRTGQYTPVTSSQAYTPTQEEINASKGLITR